MACPFHQQHNKYSKMTSPHISHLTFTIFFTFLLGISETCHIDDETGLLGFKSGIKEDPTGMLDNWIQGTDCCTQWQGISCNADTNRVESLILVGGRPVNLSVYLSGTISSSLVKLQHLYYINLNDLRNISGTFPTFLANLPKLSWLTLENNKLSGPIPVEISRLTQLTTLSLQGNRFTGSIPSSMSQLTELDTVNFGGNQLTGEIPDGFRNLKKFFVLYLDRNRLSGEIPDIFTNFSDLRGLNLSYNRFSGKIPASISYMAPQIFFLELGHNLLTGEIPDYIGNLKQLVRLDLSSNNFSGVVPKTFKNLEHLLHLDLSRNKLDGPFPKMNVQGINSVDLSYNRFKLGPIPKWISSPIGISSLKLAGCGIKMRLQDWTPLETSIYDLIDLSDNKISGSPVGLLNRTTALQGFWVSGNQLKFDMSELKLPELLKFLDLSRNQMFGKVPKSVSELKELNVSHNHLCGKIPVTKFPVGSFEGNDCLCGSPLSKCPNRFSY